MPPWGPPEKTPTVTFWPFQAGSGLPLSEASKAASACFFSSSVYGSAVAATATVGAACVGACVGAAAAGAVVGAAAAGAFVGAAAAGAWVGAAAAGALVGAAAGAELQAFSSGTTATALVSTAVSLRNARLETECGCNGSVDTVFPSRVFPVSFRQALIREQGARCGHRGRRGPGDDERARHTQRPPTRYASTAERELGQCARLRGAACSPGQSTIPRSAGVQHTFRGLGDPGCRSALPPRRGRQLRTRRRLVSTPWGHCPPPPRKIGALPEPTLAGRIRLHRSGSVSAELFERGVDLPQCGIQPAIDQLVAAPIRRRRSRVRPVASAVGAE